MNYKKYIISDNDDEIIINDNETIEDKCIGEIAYGQGSNSINSDNSFNYIKASKASENYFQQYYQTFNLIPYFLHFFKLQRFLIQEFIYIYGVFCKLVLVNL